MTDPEKRENIIVIGGGGAGAPIAKALSAKLDPAKFNLILITTRPYYTHLPGCIRMIVSPTERLEDRVLIPYDRNFVKGNGKVVIGKVVSLKEEGDKGGYITLESGEKIEYSILVLTPGSNWEGPLDMPNTKPQFLEFLRQWRMKIEKANHILLVGGGSVAVEFAGEIKDLWPFTKKVTIVHDQSLLLNRVYPRGWRKGVMKRLLKRGVELILDDHIDDLALTEGKIMTRNGKTLTPDLIIPCRGGTPNTAWIASCLEADAFVKTGHIRVSATLQLFMHPRIFAAGDVIDYYEQKQVEKYGEHAYIVARNVHALANKKLPPAIYKGMYESMCLTVGRNAGASYFEKYWGLRFGDWITSALKSQGLSIDSARKQLGQKA